MDSKRLKVKITVTSVTFSALLRETRTAEQSKVSMCGYKAYAIVLYLFFLWPIVSLYRTRVGNRKSIPIPESDT